MSRGSAGTRSTARHPSARWAIPLLIGVVYGLYAGCVDANNGTPGGRAAVFGVVAGLVVAAACFALGRRQSTMVRETRAAAYGGLLGAAMGLLFCLSGWSVLKSSITGLIVGGAMAAVVFYIRYTRED
ncbi:hypothetical protein [Streptomyces sp. URMC 123]|uniref:hypothetical protein n=1 Tax=Streptomyces sp. URMC 123 TaxID=3423403 RepID=UPI003F1BEE12